MMPKLGTATKGRPFTVRLTPALEDWIAEEAHRSKRPKSAVLEDLLAEAVRSRRFPGIIFRGPAHDRRAGLTGTALDVWEVVEAAQAMGEARLRAEGGLTEQQLRLALRYYEAYPAEIDAAIAENRRTEGEWHARYPAVVPAR